MRHVKDKESAREIGYLFQALQHEWERSGKTVVTRRIGQDEYDFSLRETQKYEICKMLFKETEKL